MRKVTKAELEYRSKNGKRISQNYAGSREEIRKAIQTEKDLPANERMQLLRALNLHDPIFEFHFPPFGPLGPASKHQP